MYVTHTHIDVCSGHHSVTVLTAMMANMGMMKAAMRPCSWGSQHLYWRGKQVKGESWETAGMGHTGVEVVYRVYVFVREELKG